jgi:hypothetical protein
MLQVILLLTFCMAGPSARCVEMVAARPSPLTSIAECEASAPDAAAGWLEDNPGWVMRSARCRVRGAGPARDA